MTPLFPSDITYGTLSYDSGNRLTQIDYTHSGSTLDDLSWSYDAANRVTGFTSSVDGLASYSYNTTNEVTGASYTGTNQPANESNSFDANGNRTNTGYTTGTNNQLTSDGTFNYTYDHEGNRVSRTRISSATASDYITDYSYDYRNRLTDVNYYNNSSVLTKHVHYVYDVYDHLIGTEIDATGSGSYSSSEWYALDISIDPNAPAQPVLQFDGSGNETYRYLNGPSASGVDAMMAEEAITTQGSAGTTTYPLADNLGSVRDIVNTSSSIVDHIVYNSFGQVAYESGTAHHWAGYAGYHADANTGLDDADHRWYDPSVGRWISEDPLGFGGGEREPVCWERDDRRRGPKRALFVAGMARRRREAGTEYSEPDQSSRGLSSLVGSERRAGRVRGMVLANARAVRVDPSASQLCDVARLLRARPSYARPILRLVGP